MENLVQYAQKVEDDMYSTAASKVCGMLILYHSSIYIFYILNNILKIEMSTLSDYCCIILYVYVKLYNLYLYLFYFVTIDSYLEPWCSI